LKTVLPALTPERLLELKRYGFADARIAELAGVSEKSIRKLRASHGIRPAFRRVDTCAAEFATSTAYMYSTWGEQCEAAATDKRKIMVLGGGPNRIGQGIEFDYCCVHAAMAMRELGFETIMVNCNPETVSTDYDTSDRLYFEPLTLENVLSIVEVEQPEGIIIQFGGQTPLKLARELEAAGAPIIGTTPDCIDLAEDRERFQRLLNELKLKQPANRTARDPDEALVLAREIGYPLVVRPSYVLGGRAMDIVYGEDELNATCARPSRCPTTHRCCSIISSTMPSRSMSMRSATARTSLSAASWSISRRPECTPAIRPAACRRFPWTSSASRRSSARPGRWRWA
jgi:carbamoyl-phosphate synthase large subunit